MFKSVKLKCFRQHRDLEINFEPGLIALRGANEAGKTSLLEALAYSHFGTVALRESLDEVVTYGEKETALKTETVFTSNGVDYTTFRSKSGAEVRIGPKVICTGQTEVRRFWETQHGASWDTVTNLMLAGQQGLRGTLAKGPGAAVELMEDLANFKLIEHVITLVQKHLPNGGTSLTEGRIKLAEQALAQPIEDTTSVLQSEVDEASRELVAAQEAKATAAQAYNESVLPARKAQERLDKARAAQDSLKAAATVLDQAKVTFAQIQPAPGPTDEEVAAAQAQVDDIHRYNRAASAYSTLQRLPEPPGEWEGDPHSLAEAIAKMQQERRDLLVEIGKINTGIAVAEAAVIRETACGLCGKDLSSVPEVVQKNAAMQAEVKRLQEILKVRQQQQSGLGEDIALHEQVQTAHRQRETVYHQAAEFITLDRSVVPARWTWTGPDMAKPVPSPGESQIALQKLKAAQGAYQRDLGRKHQAQLAVEAAQAAHAAAVQAAAATQLALDAEPAEPILQMSSKLLADLHEVESRLLEWQQYHAQKLGELKAEQRVLEERRAQQERLRQQLATDQAELAEILDNNALLARLREVRPEIATDLWNTVAGTVSQHFTNIRGTPSVVTREDSGFRINGRPVKGLSGSTLDALGLAIRMALTQTFLPNARWLILDEPAAAADMDRETAMLAVIAAGQFEQAIVVTHSDLIDAFANQVVRL